MNQAMGILREYLELRHRGISASQAVDFLRPKVETLNSAERAELVREIREFEEQRSGAGTAVPKPARGATTFLNPEAVAAMTAAQMSGPAAGRIKPLRTGAASPSPADTTPTPLFTNGGPPAAATVACPNCGRRNRDGELFCLACGYVLRHDGNAFDTVRLSDPNAPAGDYFPPNGTIMLVQRESGLQFKIRPVDVAHDIVIGRADHTIAPDIDLSAAAGDKLSVSRMHLSIRHNKITNTVAATDMGSANGTYINGQRLYPQEIRTLRHGDELRLGNLVFNIYFIQ